LLGKEIGELGCIGSMLTIVMESKFLLIDMKLAHFSTKISWEEFLLVMANTKATNPVSLALLGANFIFSYS
jgi:hypothetical protein